MLKVVKIIVPVMGLVVLAGCANWKSIHRSEDIPNSAHVISVDAKQRLLVSNNVTENQLKRFCAEPSPDVFSVLASSLGASASAALAPDKNMDFAAQFSHASSENAATIERSQTTNVLREMMYRNCERYLSGGISGDELIIQAARDQRAIISIMAIDHLTGVPRAQATALSAQATASTGAAEIATAYQKARDDARLAEETAQKSQQTCAEADAAKKQAACKQAEDDKKRAEEAKNHESLMKKAMTAITAASTVTAQTVGAGGAASKLPGIDPSLANTVLQIVKDTNAFNEIEMTCVVLFRNIAHNLSDIKSQSDSSLYSKFSEYFDKCLNLLDKKFTQIASEMELQTTKNYVELRKLDSELIGSDSNMIWSMVNGDSAKISKAIELLRQRGINLNPLFANNVNQYLRDKQSFENSLGLLSTQQRRELIRALQTE